MRAQAGGQMHTVAPALLLHLPSANMDGTPEHEGLQLAASRKSRQRRACCGHCVITWEANSQPSPQSAAAVSTPPRHARPQSLRASGPAAPSCLCGSMTSAQLMSASWHHHVWCAGSCCGGLAGWTVPPTPVAKQPRCHSQLQVHLHVGLDTC